MTDYVSIGDYVLTGGELPAMVMIDAISRMVPGVLSNGESGTIESFHDNLLEYPQYSRPEVWRDQGGSAGAAFRSSCQCGKMAARGVHQTDTGTAAGSS